MDIKKWVLMAVSVITAAVVFGACLPVFADTTQANDTFTNEGYFTYDKVISGTNLTISHDPADPGVITIGDKDITMPTGTGNWTICGSENFTVRYSATANNKFLQVYGTAGYLAGDPGSEEIVTVDVSDVEVVFHRNSSTSKTYTMGTHGFVINPDGDGDLTLKYGDTPAYILEDSEIYLCGTTFVTGSGTNDFVGVFGYGDVDSVTLSSFYGNTGGNTVSFGTPTINAEEVDTHIDLYKITSVVFPLTQNSATVTATYSYFVVPTEVTAERAAHPEGATLTLMELLPVLIGAGLLLGVAGYVIKRKM